MWRKDRREEEVLFAFDHHLSHPPLPPLALSLSPPLAVMTDVKAWLRVAPLEKLAASSRHHLTLRHPHTHEYHSLLIFSFPSATSSSTPQPHHDAFYCMEATCPHLGAPLENATIEAKDVDEEDDDIEDMVVVCPWHEYDFSLSTGESSHGISACVYKCQVREQNLWIEAPQPCSNEAIADPKQWETIELRPVSEASPGVASRQDAAQSLHLEAAQLSLASSTPQPEAVADREVAPPSPRPKTLVEWAVLVLNTPEPAKKVAYTRFAAKAFRSGECKLIGGGRWKTSDEVAGTRTEWMVKPQETPPERPPRLKDEVCVRPGQEAKRGRGGTEKSRIAILHSLANIEQWAIDLAWDIIARAPQLCARFFSEHDDDEAGETANARLPLQFFSDFVKVAEDEAKHFSLLVERLGEMGSYFGALPVHHGLWDSAMETAHSLTARLSIIHLVHEARGLDVNPTTIKKFDNAGDAKSVKTLTVIHLDEITHVSAGHRWLTWLCARAHPAMDPVQVFRDEVRRNFIGRLKGPFNADDRRKAGLDKEWYDDLVGEKPGTFSMGVRRNEVPGG